MRDLYSDPAFYGIQDVTISAISCAARILYPADDDTVVGVPIRRGTYPLVVFAHGSRAGDTRLCPADISQDYKRWLKVLHPLARCGFVVVSPDVAKTVADPDAAAGVLEETVRWMHRQWSDRAVLWRPAVFLEPDHIYAEAAGHTRHDKNLKLADAAARRPLALGHGIDVDPTAPGGMTTPIGLAGHSWGARACARAAVRGTLHAEALASIAGSWDDNASIDALRLARLPTLMMAGTGDEMNVSYLTHLWSSLSVPKHQALLFDLGHWDWFGAEGGIQPCDQSEQRPRCTIGWWTAGELILTFMTKYLRRQYHLPPTLIGPSGVSEQLLAGYENPMGCGLKVRWNDPATDGYTFRRPEDNVQVRDHRTVGSHGFGSFNGYPF